MKQDVPKSGVEFKGGVEDMVDNLMSFAQDLVDILMTCDQKE